MFTPNSRASAPLSISGSADSRVLSIRNRLSIIKQSVLRNEHFAPSTLPSRDRERLVTLKSTKQLLGRAGERFLLLGMLTHNKEGKLCVEDADGSVELDLSKLVSLSYCIGLSLRPVTGRTGRRTLHGRVFCSSRRGIHRRRYPRGRRNGSTTM